jgi:hypothetical protein
LRFANCRDCLDAEIGVRYFRQDRTECNERLNPETSQSGTK